MAAPVTTFSFCSGILVGIAGSVEGGACDKRGGVDVSFALSRDKISARVPFTAFQADSRAPRRRDVRYLRSAAPCCADVLKAEMLAYGPTLQNQNLRPRPGLQLCRSLFLNGFLSGDEERATDARPGLWHKRSAQPSSSQTTVILTVLSLNDPQPSDACEPGKHALFIEAAFCHGIYSTFCLL